MCHVCETEKHVVTLMLELLDRYPDRERKFAALRIFYRAAMAIPPRAEDLALLQMTDSNLFVKSAPPERYDA